MATYTISGVRDLSLELTVFAVRLIADVSRDGLPTHRLCVYADYRFTAASTVRVLQYKLARAYEKEVRVSDPKGKHAQIIAGMTSVVTPRWWWRWF